MCAKRIHEKDVAGTQVVDFEERVDVRRLRRERIGRIQAELARANLGGLLLFDPINVRYAIGARNFETFLLHLKGRHALIPREGKPILFMPSVTEAPVLGEDVIGRPRVEHGLVAYGELRSRSDEEVGGRDAGPVGRVEHRR